MHITNITKSQKKKKKKKKKNKKKKKKKKKKRKHHPSLPIHPSNRQNLWVYPLFITTRKENVKSMSGTHIYVLG
jgi:hypothetical protein